MDAKTGIKAEIRASIALIKHDDGHLDGFFPHDSKIKDLVKNKGKIWEAVNNEDITEAYYNGDEVSVYSIVNMVLHFLTDTLQYIFPWVMRCVGYDEDFQRKLLDNETYKGIAIGDTTSGGPGPSTKKRKVLGEQYDIPFF